MPEQIHEKIIESITAAEKYLETADSEVSLAEAAGIDVTKERELLERKREELDRLKAVYLP